MLQCMWSIICAFLSPILEHGTHFVRIISPISESSPNPYLAADYACNCCNILPEMGRPEPGGHRAVWEFIKSLSKRDCLYRFRLYADELADLADALEIPEPFYTQSRYKFTRVEALALLLARFRLPGNIFDLSMLYNRSASSISEVVNELSEYIDVTWKHLLDFDHNGVLSLEKLEDYADAIHHAGSPVTSIWGFLDCTIRAICRPSQWQRQAYNGYKKIHALKFQAVRLPNGHFGHLFGPVEGRRNDNHLLAESRLLDVCAVYTLRRGANENTPIHRRFFQLFGDPAYGLGPCILSPFSGGDRTDEQMEWNAAMSSLRIEVEHGFSDVTRLWPFLNAWWKHRVYSSPVGQYYRVGVLLTNAHNCIRPNQTSQYFNCEPPVLEDYFHH